MRNKYINILGLLILLGLHMQIINEEIIITVLFSIIVYQLYKKTKKIIKINQYNERYKKMVILKFDVINKIVIEKIINIYNKNINIYLKKIRSKKTNWIKKLIKKIKNNIRIEQIKKNIIKRITKKKRY